MAKFAKHKRNPSQKTVLISLGLIIFLSFIYLRFFTAAQPAQIFQIDPVSISYGDTTLDGILQKDSPTGQDGTYLLALADGRPVILEFATGLDHLLGSRVSVSGYLAPLSNSSAMTMRVNTITIIPDSNL